MADDSHQVRLINWKEIFPFIVLFRGFRIAIHPSKLVLALVALILVYAGGSFMDLVWPSNLRAVPDEITLFESSRNSLDHDAFFKSLRGQQIQEQDAQRKAALAAIGKPDGDVRDLKWKILQDRDAAVKAAEAEYAKSPNPVVGETMRQVEIKTAYDDARIAIDQLENARPGLFVAFREYEIGQINSVARAVRSGNFIGIGGVTQGLIRFFVTAPSWALRQHWLFFGIYGIYFLTIWSVFGGAITRIAAVHFARDEKISIRQALAFSTSKFLSFVSAPVIPVLIIVAMGLLLTIAGILINIPILGPIVVGAFFFFALAAGFVMTLVLLGLAGGFNLMYPTIAVEGSDSFDAISRSFSYLYARPWRMGFYSAVAIGYGALTYLFVRYFIYVLLSLVNVFLGRLVFTHSASLAPLWQTLWPSPDLTGRLSYEIDWTSLSPGEAIGAVLISFWVHLAVYMLGAFTISFYFSISTIIYYLMRQEVDATEIDDVFLEQTDEEFAETPPGISPTDGPADSATVVTVTTIAQGAPPASA
jgi:hypothetical protein